MGEGSHHHATELLPGPATAPLVLCCEHASNRLPPGWSWPAADRWVVDTHWAWDPGAAVVTRHLAARFRAPAVLSRFTRLLVDPNRPEDSPGLIRNLTDGRSLALNHAVDEVERERRLEALYRPYHRALDRAVAGCPGARVLSVHSFTPCYEGTPRQVEVGVLYELDEAPARALCGAIAAEGWDARLNQPWSGLEGLVFSPQSHALRHGRAALELELRQDLLADPARVERLLGTLERALAGWLAGRR